MTTLLDIRNLSAVFPGRRRSSPVRALSCLTLALEKGESLSVIGESGSGKTTPHEVHPRPRSPVGGVHHPLRTGYRLGGRAGDDSPPEAVRHGLPGPYGSLPPPSRSSRRQWNPGSSSGKTCRERREKSVPGTFWPNSDSGTRPSFPPGCASPSREASASGSPSPGR